MRFAYVNDAERARLTKAGRKPQCQFGRTGDILHFNAKGDPIRVYLNTSVQDNAGKDQFENLTETIRGGAVVIPWDKATGMIGLTEIERPILPAKHLDELLKRWDIAFFVDVDNPDFRGFGEWLLPLVGLRLFEVPQGYSDPGETLEQNARRVLKMKAGYEPIGELRLLKPLFPDPGNRIPPVPHFLAEVDRFRQVEPSKGAGLPAVHWVTERVFLKEVRDERILSQFSLSAYALLRAYDIFM